jgi:predicted DNA-binding transcriptional regulator AlpA
MAEWIKHITKTQVLQMTGFDEANLDRAICNGVFPEPIELGDYIRWLEPEVVDWIVQSATQLEQIKKRLGVENEF